MCVPIEEELDVRRLALRIPAGLAMKGLEEVGPRMEQMVGSAMVSLYYPYIFLLRIFVTFDVCSGKIYRVYMPQSPLSAWNMFVVASRCQLYAMAT